MSDGVFCVQVGALALNCSDGQQWMQPEPPLNASDGLFWLYLGLSVALVLFGGLMSGLTLGLLSMDLTTLAIIMRGSDQARRRYAKAIIGLISRRHQLLVTLLLCNAAAMETLPIFLDRIVSTVIAIVVSVTAVLAFGEIIPQAICSRYGLAIGANLSWLVWALVIITWPLNWPLGILLDWLLGIDHGTHYDRSELKELVDLHGKHAATETNTEGLNIDEITVIKSALDMTLMHVSDLTVPIEKVYALEESTQLDGTIVAEMHRRGVSRVPVYRARPGNVVGVIIVKNLAGMPLGTQAKDCVVGRVVRVPCDMGIYDLLNIFQTGAGHMAIVYPASLPSHAVMTDKMWLEQSPSSRQMTVLLANGNDASVTPATPSTEASTTVLLPPEAADLPDAIGICTLRDVLQTLLKEEIRDEADFEKLDALLAKPSRGRPVLSATTGIVSPVNPNLSSSLVAPSRGRQLTAADVILTHTLRRALLAQEAALESISTSATGISRSTTMQANTPSVSPTAAVPPRPPATIVSDAV